MMTVTTPSAAPVALEHPYQRSDLPDVVEVLYEVTPQARAYVDEFRLPPDFIRKD